MDAKKISFGFSKIVKKPNLLPPKQLVKDENKVELIKCLEGKEIKLIEEKPEEAPLVIKMKENHKTSSALLSLIKRRAVLLGEEKEEAEEEESQQKQKKCEGDSNVRSAGDTLEQRAAKELLASLQGSSEIEEDNKLVLPVVKADDLPLDGAKESTMDDYDSIPIQQFGVAMLRGMGWVEPPKKKGGPPIDEGPMVRPKGMGLGADKALKKKPLLVAPEPNEVLQVKKNAYVRILGGKYKDLYGQIEGFDEHAGRVIVKMAIGGNKEVFNEFMCQPVARKEYTEYGKCLNTAKYEEYKKMENQHTKVIVKEEKEKPYIKKEIIKDEYLTNEFKDIKKERINDDYKDERFDVKPTKEELRQALRYEEERQKASIQKHHSFKDEFKREKSEKEHKHKHGCHDIKIKEEPNKHYENDVHKSRVSNSKDFSAHKVHSARRSRSRERHEHKKHRHARRASSTSTSTSSESSPERKPKKSGKKKHKSKHRKHKRSNSSDSTTSTTSNSSSVGERRRHRSHKRKTRKNKKRHGRSRSRGRR